MTATIGDTYLSSSSSSLLHHYLDSIIIKHNNNHVLSKLNILDHPMTLFETGEELARKIPSSCRAVVLLAYSGIPLGVVVAQYRLLPLYFYKSKEWDNLGKLMPRPPAGLELAIVDSHIRSGLTSQSSERLLIDDYRAKMCGIFVPMRFDPAFAHPVQAPTYLLDEYESVQVYLSNKMGIPTDEINKRLSSLTDPFWSYPPTFSSLPTLLKPAAKWRRWPLYFHYPSPPPAISLLSNKTETLLHPYLQSSDENVWYVYQVPEVLRNVCEIVGEEFNLERVDYLVGVECLGIALAVSLAYNNRDSFKGTIISWSEENGLLPRHEDLGGKNIVLVSMRVQYGTLVAGAATDIQEHGGRVSDIIFGISDPSPESLTLQISQMSLGGLTRAGVRMYRLS